MLITVLQLGLFNVMLPSIIVVVPPSIIVVPPFGASSTATPPCGAVSPFPKFPFPFLPTTPSFLANHM